MSRTTRSFEYENADGGEGYVNVSWGDWSTPGVTGEAPIMVSFESPEWMGVTEAERFLRWLKVALAEAKRKHPRDE